MEEREQHIDTTSARAGATPHMARVALFGGLGLVILIFAIILLVGGN